MATSNPHPGQGRKVHHDRGRYQFERLYARVGRPSIAPEKLLRALLLQAFRSVRSER